VIGSTETINVESRVTDAVVCTRAILSSGVLAYGFAVAVSAVTGSRVARVVGGARIGEKL
jgi:hypothetical protein